MIADTLNSEHTRLMSEAIGIAALYFHEALSQEIMGDITAEQKQKIITDCLGLVTSAMWFQSLNKNNLNSLWASVRKNVHTQNVTLDTAQRFRVFYDDQTWTEILTRLAASAKIFTPENKNYSVFGEEELGRMGCPNSLEYLKNNIWVVPLMLLNQIEYSELLSDKTRVIYNKSTGGR